jgi:hypothetical protein
MSMIGELTWTVLRRYIHHQEKYKGVLDQSWLKEMPVRRASSLECDIWVELSAVAGRKVLRLQICLEQMEPTVTWAAESITVTTIPSVQLKIVDV